MTNHSADLILAQARQRVTARELCMPEDLTQAECGGVTFCFVHAELLRQGMNHARRWHDERTASAVARGASMRFLSELWEELTR